MSCSRRHRDHALAPENASENGAATVAKTRGRAGHPNRVTAEATGPLRARRAPLVLLASIACLALTACGSSHGADRDGGARDGSTAADAGGRDGGQGGDDAGACAAIRCPVECSLGVGSDGCPTCRCPEGACTNDDDCVIARRLDLCCGECPRAVSRVETEANVCLARFGDPAPSSCYPATCGDEPCLPEACAPGLAAECGPDNRCTERSCAPDEVEGPGGECVPRCTSHADCVMATHVVGCCYDCQGAYHRSLAAERPCLATADGVPPSECMGDLDFCSAADCPDIDCVEGHAVCMDSGDCQVASDPLPCPPGSRDDGRVCTIFDGT